jgi:hypothetical protein
MSMAPYDKRRWARHRRHYSVALGPYSSFTLDVCSAGFCARSTRRLRRGADLECAMRVGERWVSFGGQVAWSRPGNASALPGGEVGVRFTRVPWDLQRLLGSPSPR